MQKNIRNFCIIAHIDHGKSTLADRFIQMCGHLSSHEKQSMEKQMLDSMDLERERGITIKAQCVTLQYQASDGISYQFNLIDTPGHVDFAYEVSRSLAACEGALLLVDASQGVEAQSVANSYTAIAQGLEVVPVLNKIDLPAADPSRVAKDINAIIGIDADDAIHTSAKTGVGVDLLLERIVTQIPPPVGDEDAPLQALVVDSWFDNFLGVIMLVRIVNGVLSEQDKIQFMNSGNVFRIDGVGVFTPKRVKRPQLLTGEVGYVIAGAKDIDAARVGDTITLAQYPAASSLPGFSEVQPRVFAGLFPANTDDYPHFRDSLSKLRLNDAALHFEPESSQALGFGFRCGFLGMLHMEVIQERLEREYGLNLITTAPTVIHELLLTNGEVTYIYNPMQLPPTNQIAEIREPIIKTDILVPEKYISDIYSLCFEKRGVQKRVQYLGTQVSLSYELPLSEVVIDFFDRLKSCSRGYASFDYSFAFYRSANLVRLDILINHDRVDALSLMVNKENSQRLGRNLVERIQEYIPRQMFEVAIQAAIGSTIIARASVKALRKNVTAKCYGGDITRKRKLIEKQKAGKKRMKKIGKIDIPQEAFLAILSIKH